MYIGAFRINRKLVAFVLSLGIALSCAFFVINSAPAQAVAGVSQQINFQGRLFNAQGATVPDGYYNIEFRIYQDGDGQTVGNTTGSPAGALKWTESHLNANTQGIMVKNGYMSVQLGSVNAFGSSVDWNQDTLWLSMNIGNTNVACTPFASCGPDGEMTPMKRLSSTPFSLNSGLLGGLSSAQFLQLAQGVQNDTALNTSSIYINKTGTGNLLQLQGDGNDVLTVEKAGDVVFGAQTDHSLSVAKSADEVEGKFLYIYAGDAGNTTGSLDGGGLYLQGGYGAGTTGRGGDITVDAGGGDGANNDGNVAIGTLNASSIYLGKNYDSSGEQNIYIGNRSLGGTTNVTLGTGGAATSGTTTLQAKTDITIKTDGTTRATFNNANSLYLGNGVSAGAPNNFTISGTNSSTTAVSGGALTIQGGNATTGSANGGNITLSGGAGTGTGANGLVVITTPTFSTTTNDPNCYTGGSLVATSCTVATASVNNSAAVLVGFSQQGQIATLPNPTLLTAGRILYITAANGSADFTLAVNGGGVGNVVAMRQNTSATMIWNGTDWTAAGASSSTTLQSAYDSTLQSAGGAELIVAKTGNTNGLTIRDSSTNAVNGTLLSVQTSSAASLFSINSNVTEYASNGGAEITGSGGDTSFPASTWSAIGSSAVSRYITAGNFIATGKGSVTTTTTSALNDGVRNTLNTALTAKTNYNVSFATRLTSGTFTDMTVHYSIDGTATSVPCTTNQAVTTSVWTKVNCTFTAPASGITASNAILIRQASSGTARTFYIDNLSVAIAADYNYASDGSVSDNANFATNWTAASGATVTRSTSAGFDASDSARAVTTGAGQGVRNKLAISPLDSTLYRVTVYAASTTGGFNNFTVRYSPDGGTTFVNCADYNTQTVSSSLTDFTKVTCYITTGTTPSVNPYVYFTQTDATGRTFHVDALSMTLSSSATPNVQIGGGVNGGPATLLTLDRSASAPIASNNDALLGSMYYDTSLGKLQCYEADGWGACGSSPDSIVTIAPEYNNAVLHGTGVGTMVSDICSGPLDINDGSSGQPNVCGANETYNFYKWTSPQATAQTYSIYVTYQLPANFSGFASGQTSIMGRTDSTNSTVQYQVYRNAADTGMTACGSPVTVSSGSVASWQTGVASGTADPSTCGFAAGNSIVFKVNVTASQNASAYVGNLNFTFNNR